MRFQCLNPECKKPFGWTAKKIVSGTGKEGEIVTYEYVVCPYCGSLDFEELPSTWHHKKIEEFQKKRDKLAASENHTKSLPQPTNQFDPADLMEHNWKGRKQGEGNYSAGSLKYGWDFADQFKPETIKALELGPLTVDKYVFKFTGKIVQTKKAE